MNTAHPLAVFRSIFAVIVLFFMQSKIAAADPLSWSMGQTVYVPTYSHIFIGDRLKTFDLTTSLAIRNSDPERPITITRVDYIGASGRLVRRLLTTPSVVRPVASLIYVIPESDKSGGVGASFLVSWKSAVKVSSPVVESVMIGTGMQQGISFTSRGQVVRETAP